MKKFALTAIGAKYIHSSLALRYLSRFADNDRRHDLTLVEFTINQRLEFMLAELFRLQPDVIMVSCYIWNIELVKRLLPELKKVLPDVVIVLGGPEVSYSSRALLEREPAVDMIMRGEGEATITELLDYLDGAPITLSSIKGLTYRSGGEICQTPEREPLDLALLPFAYEHDELAGMDKIIYYESSRGCPYSCAYCLSSVEKGVRFVPLDKVFAELARFLQAGVRQVKFVDRTFNCNKAHTLAVWRFLAEHDNGVTNFHFELTADLLDEELLAFLQPLRRGLFQFEIGVQSTNAQTLQAIRRSVSFERLRGLVKRVHGFGNIHQHLDLIAGLPYEDYASFGRSFNDVYELEPEQLQLGFLKVLSGTYLAEQAEKWGIKSRDYAPYEVLCTEAMGPGEMLRLKDVAEMVELFYNSGQFQHTLRALLDHEANAFGFYEALAERWVQQGQQYASHSRLSLCDFLYDFARTRPGFAPERFKWLLKLDLCLHEKPKRLPAWLDKDLSGAYRAQIIDFWRTEAQTRRWLPHLAHLESKALARQAHLEIFPDRTVLLFDYAHRDMLGSAHCMEITEAFWQAWPKKEAGNEKSMGKKGVL